MNAPEITNVHFLSWNGASDCLFEATITNNKISALHFCEPPAKSGEERVCLTTINEPFIRQTAQYLTELVRYMDDLISKTGTFKLDEITQES